MSVADVIMITTMLRVSTGGTMCDSESTTIVAKIPLTIIPRKCSKREK